MIRALAALAALAVLAACGEDTGSAPARPAALTPAEVAQRIAALPAPYNSADYEHGRRVAAQCRSCHTFGAGEGNRVGPNLHGVFGRVAGTAPAFAYSDAVRGAGFTWDDDHLDHWLTNPRTFLPGNRMGFPGLSDPIDRRDAIAYLQIETAR